MKLKTEGVSPKVVADLIVSVVSFALTAGVIELDPVLSAAISKFLGSLAGVFAGPGAVTAVYKTGRDEDGYGLVEVALGLLILFIALAVLVRYVL